MPPSGKQLQHGIGGKLYWPIRLHLFIDLDFIEKMADGKEASIAPGGSSEESGTVEGADEDDQNSEHADCVEEKVYQQLIAPPENQ